MSDDWEWCSVCRQFADECECEPAREPLEDFENGYANELGTCWSGLDWAERANANPFCMSIFLRARYSEPDRFIEVASRASPLLQAVARRAVVSPEPCLGAPRGLLAR